MQVFFKTLLIVLLPLASLAAEDAAPLEPPYTRSPQQAAPIEPPYSKLPEPNKDEFQLEDLSLRPIPKPTHINEDTGTYYYDYESADEAVYYDFDNVPPITGSIFVRFGTMGPYDIQNATGHTYEQLYDDKPQLVAYFEYEWLLGHLLGKWFIKAGTGITIADGNGRFSDPGETRTPREKFLFGVFPNSVLLNYKLRFSDKQWLTPYIEGGGGYMGYIEYRTDGDRTGFGGAPFLAAAGGLLLNLNIIDRNASNALYEDYGIHQLWFDVQFRRNIGLDDEKDFSSNMITAGFGFAY